MNMFKHFDTILKNDKEEAKKSAVLSIVNECTAKDSSEAAKSFEYAVKRFTKGLQSSNESTRVEFFAGLVALLQLIREVPVSNVIELIEKGLARTDSLTKQEKRMMYVARILAYGAVLKARGTSDEHVNEAVVQLCVHNIVEVAKLKNFYCSLGVPFILYTIEIMGTKQLSAEVRKDIEQLMVKQEKPKLNLDYLIIAITAACRGFDPPLGDMFNMDELVEILMASVNADDGDRLKVIFDYVREKNQFDEFWKSMVAKVGPYDAKMFCTCVTHSILNGCPLQHVLLEEVVHMLLSSLHTRELGLDIRNRAINGLSKLADWKDTSMSTKERKHGLKVLYKKTPNLLHEYQTLVSVIRQNLTSLTAKELTNLGCHCKEVVTSAEEETTLRNRLSALSLLRHIMQSKNATAEVQVSAASFFFTIGFCDDSNIAKLENDEFLTSLRLQASQNFITSLRKVLNPEFVDALYEQVKTILGGENDSVRFREELPKEVQDMWKRSQKLIPKISDATLSVISKLGAMELIQEDSSIVAVYDVWLEMVKATIKKAEETDVASFIINNVTEMENPFFNYEAVFRTLARNDRVSEDAVQAMADVIDVADEEGEPEESGSSDDDDDEDDAEAINLGQKISTSMNATPESKLLTAEDEAEESDATVDMDDATEEDLKKMDEALAGVFSTKKRLKNASKLSEARYMRVLNLVDVLLGRHKEPPISIYLILLMPLITAFKHYATVQPSQNQNAMKKTLATLRRLSKFKKFANSADADKDALLIMAQEIRVIMKKKYVTKDVKNVLYSCVQTLETVGGLEVLKGKEDKPSKSKKKNKKKKVPNGVSVEDSQVSKIAVTSSDSHLKDVNGTEAVQNIQSGTKRKANRGQEKKKAKLLRMSVLSEGLSNHSDSVEAN